MSRALVLRMAVGAASRLRVVRGSSDRIAFPFLRIRRDPVYQIFVYHRVVDGGGPYFPGIPVARFERQMELLATTHRLLDLEELLQRASRREVPPGAAAVTFDDGYADFHEHAAPILERYGVPATVFLATGPLEGLGPLWHDRVFSAFARSEGRALEIEGTRYPMATAPDRRASLESFLARIRAGTPETRERCILALYAAMGLAAAAVDTPRMLTWSEVEDLSRRGIRFGAHTVTHPILTRLERERAAREVLVSKETIERRLGVRVRLFAYPVGGIDDFDDSVKGIVRDAGFAGAVTTLWGGNDALTDPFELRRVRYWGEKPERTLVRLAWYRLNDSRQA